MQRQRGSERGGHPSFKVLHSGPELLIGRLECTAAGVGLLAFDLHPLQALLCILPLFLQGSTLREKSELSGKVTAHHHFSCQHSHTSMMGLK